MLVQLVEQAAGGEGEAVMIEADAPMVIDPGDGSSRRADQRPFGAMPDDRPIAQDQAKLFSRLGA